MIRNPRFHRWSNTERLVDPAEVVVHVMQGDVVGEIVGLFAECVGQPGKPAHLHSHREILPFNVAG